MGEGGQLGSSPPFTRASPAPPGRIDFDQGPSQGRPVAGSALTEARARAIEWDRVCLLALRRIPRRRPEGRRMSGRGGPDDVYSENNALHQAAFPYDPRPGVHHDFAVVSVNGQPVAGTATASWAYLYRPSDGGPWQVTLERRPLSFLDLRAGEAACPTWAKNWVRHIQSRIEDLPPGGRRRALALIGVAALTAASRGAGRAARTVFRVAANNVTSWLAAASTLAFAHGSAARHGVATESDVGSPASPDPPDSEP